MRGISRRPCRRVVRFVSSTQEPPSRSLDLEAVADGLEHAAQPELAASRSSSSSSAPCGERADGRAHRAVVDVERRR